MNDKQYQELKNFDCRIEKTIATLTSTVNSIKNSLNNLNYQKNLIIRNNGVEITPLNFDTLDFLGGNAFSSGHTVKVTFPNGSEGSILDYSVTNTKLALAPALTLKGNKFVTNSEVQDLTVSEIKTLLSYNKGDIGLGLVDNTSDLNKPLSNADIAALAAKAPLNSPTFIGTPTAPTPLEGDNSTKLATTAFVFTAIEDLVAGTVPDATNSVKGKLKLAGDLGGTADLPTVPELANKQATLVSGTNIKTINGSSILGSGNLVITGGETNTASNVGISGVGIFKQKTGVDLEFKKLNAGSNKITITDDVANNEIDVDVVVANLTGIAQSQITNLTSDLALKAPINSPTFTGTVSGITKSMVGLNNVDNTSDLNKPISTATQSALDLKQDILVSGTSIKTINSTSLLGSGDISIDLSVKQTNIQFQNEGVALGTSGTVDVINFTGAPVTASRTGNTVTVDITGGGGSPGDITKVDDTNVTLTLGGTPTGSVLNSVSFTLGWTGTLADGRIASASNWNSAYSNRITSLTTTGNSGASTLISNVLNIPNYTLAGLGGISLTSLSSTATGLTYTNTTGVFSLTSGYVIPTTTQETNWNTAYTNRITSLTTTGSSGAATLVSNVLNIPNYTLAGLGGQPLDADLTAIAALTGTSGFLKTDGAGIWTVDTNTYLTGNQSITLSGEASGSGTTGISVTLSNSAVIGKVLTGFTSTTGTILATDSILQAIQKLDGNLAAATAGGVSSVTGTTNRITSTGGSNPIIDISASYVGQSSITTLGTISTGVWQGTTVDELYGGTGISTYTTGDILYSSATNTLTKLPISTNGKVLTIAAGIPSWETPSSGVTDHTALSNLVWTSSSHTGTASRIAGFNGSGVASYYQIGVDLQGYDATLNALASYNTNGILTQTGVDTFVGRSLEGTTNRITLTNGDGVLGNPTVDISNNYVGQSSITTLGTVTTGIWNGTAIGDSYISSASTWNSKQAAYTNLTSIGALANSAGVLTNDGSGVFSYTSITGYTTEEAQDAVGAMVDSTLVYNDATPLLTRAALTGAITASQGSNTTSLGSFTLSQLNTAISDADVATGGGTATGTNTGDNAVNILYSGLVSNATHTGDATGSTALTVVGINGILLSGLATGILKNTTGTGVPSIALAGDFPTLNQNTTGSAATLTTGRTISITGDLAYTSPSFDGSGNVTAAGTLATVNTNVGSFGSSTEVGTFTVNGKGLVTAAGNVTITPAASSITGGAALTKVDDTNVTLTLGGSHATALLGATSITVGWTGTLDDNRITSASVWNLKQAGIQFQDEGSNLGTSNTVTGINFTGNGISASRTGNIITVDVGATSGVTNLTYTSSATDGIVVSDTGTDATIPVGTTLIAGLMIPAQFDKLSNISITQAVDLDALETDVADLTTLSGVASNSTTLGTFTGTTIPDSSTVKAALQSLETSLEANYVVTNRTNKIRVVSANTTLSATTDGTVVFDTASTVATLPSPTSEVILAVKNVSGGNITVTGHLDGVATQTFTIASLESYRFHSNGTTWYIIS